MVAREAGKSGVLQLAQSKGPAIMLAVFLARVLPLLFALVCSYLGLIEGWVSSLFWLSIVSVSAVVFQFGCDRDIIYLVPKSKDGGAGNLTGSLCSITAGQFLLAAFVSVVAAGLLANHSEYAWTLVLIPFHLLIKADGCFDKAKDRVAQFSIKADPLLYISFFVAFMVEQRTDILPKSMLVLACYVVCFLLFSRRSLFVAGVVQRLLQIPSWRKAKKFLADFNWRKTGTVRRRRFFLFGLVYNVRANMLHFFLPVMPTGINEVVLFSYRLFALTNMISVVQNLFLPQRFAARKSATHSPERLLQKSLAVSSWLSAVAILVLLVAAYFLFQRFAREYGLDLQTIVLIAAPVAFYFFLKNAFASLKAFLNMRGKSAGLALFSDAIGLFYLLCAYASLAWMPNMWHASVAFAIFTCLSALEVVFLKRRAERQHLLAY